MRRFIYAGQQFGRLRRILKHLTSWAPLVLTLHSSLAAGAQLGAVKPDLMLQYVSSAPPNSEVGSGDIDGYRYIRTMMAKKAIADAADAGLTFMRVGVTGFRPSGFDDKVSDVALWQRAPADFWARLDEMFDDLDRQHVQIVPMLIWNVAQFPSIMNESVAAFIRNPQSASRKLFTKFITEFINRYKDRGTILFYQLTSEQNLAADVELSRECRKIDLGSRPCVWADYSSADLLKFSYDMVSLIKSLDPKRLVSSGYSFPRPAASHLARRPEFGPGGADWTPDTPDEFGQHLLWIHQPFDIISIHLYPGSWSNRFGRLEGENDELVADAAAAAKSARKKLFIGEFGDHGGATPFMQHMLDEIVRNRVDYAAIWVWEFYQTSTHQTYNSPATQFNVEPGYSDALIALLKKTEEKIGDVAPHGSPSPRPRVVLTWPLPCSTIDRSVELAAVASDGAVGVKKVEFFANAKLVGTATAPPYRVRFDPALLGSTLVKIEARAYGASGEPAQFATTVRLNDASLACRVNPP